MLADRLAVVDVERLAGELVAALAPQLDLEEVRPIVVGRDQREAVLDQLRLVDREVRELGGHDRATGNQRHPPHERDLGLVALFAPPGSDHVVVEVELPVGVLLRQLSREIGSGSEFVRSLLALAERDVTEQLIAAGGSRHRGDVRASAVGPVREPRDLGVDFADVLALGVDLADRVAEVAGERVAPTAVRQRLLRGLGGEGDDESIGGRHGRWTSLPRTAGAGAQPAQNAPRRVSTAGIVFSRIDRSSMIDHRSRYRKSSRTRSSKSSSARPETCHSPVMPGSTR